MKSGELVQQQEMQGNLVGADGDGAGIQAAVPLDLLLSQAQLLVGHRHPQEQPPPLGRQGDALVGADKELAPQLLLQVVHAPGDVGLVVA